MVDITGGRTALEASGIQSQAALAGIPIQQQALATAGQDIRPFIEVGRAALGSQAALAGLATPEAQQAAIQQIQESPAQRFIRDREERALLRSASAIGGLGGGNIRTALQEQAAGFAIQDLESQRRQLSGLAGRGQIAGTTLGQFGLTTAGSVADLQQAEAEARASGILAEREAEVGFVEDLSGALTSIFG